MTQPSLPAGATPAAGASGVALVTGAARRLGREIALELGRAGYAVAVHHRQSSPAEALDALRSQGTLAQAFAADLADEAACKQLLPRVVTTMGRVDLVVHSASRFEHDDVAGFSYASMEAHWRANTAPAIVLGRSLNDHLARRNAQGCLVTLLDQKLWNPNPDYFSYTLSKAALECATQLMARALAPRTRVCGVAPGITLPTEGTMDEASFAQAHRRTPLGRASTPQDVARAVRFLAESPAITGTTLLVDGGQHLQAQPRDVAFLSAHSPP